MPPPMVPGIQDRNSNPVIKFSRANFDTFLSKAAEPAIILLFSNIDKCEKDFPNLIITPLKPPSLIKVFEPASYTLSLL